MNILDEACCLRDLVFYYIKDAKSMTDLQLMRMLTIYKKVDDLCNHIAFDDCEKDDE